MEKQEVAIKNNKIDPKHDKVYAFTEEEHIQHVKDVISEYKFDKSRETELHLLGEDFLQTDEEVYFKVRPSETNEDGIKKIHRNINIAEILLRMSETLTKINDSLMIISYRIEGE